jgi:hypothetical protein
MPSVSLHHDATVAAHPAEAGEPHEGGAPQYGRTPRRRSWFAELIVAPFQDIDERVRVKR